MDFPKVVVNVTNFCSPFDQFSFRFLLSMTLVVLTPLIQNILKSPPSQFPNSSSIQKLQQKCQV